MGSDPVVGLPLAFNDHLCFPVGVEEFPIQQLVPQLAIEALDIAVLPRASWFELQRSHPHPAEPLPPCVAVAPSDPPSHAPDPGTFLI